MLCGYCVITVRGVCDQWFLLSLLQLYTVSSDVSMQRSVLQLLIHLVQIRVNYCLLDSDQIFIGYVIKQFEYIEEGQIK